MLEGGVGETWNLNGVPWLWDVFTSSERWCRAGRRAWSAEGESRLVPECLGVRRGLSSLLQIPMSVLEISSSQHPVKTGLSDAFMTVNTSPDVPGKSAGIQQRPGPGGTQLRLTRAGGGRGGGDGGWVDRGASRGN